MFREGDGAQHGGGRVALAHYQGSRREEGRKLWAREGRHQLGARRRRTIKRRATDAADGLADIVLVKGRVGGLCDKD